MCLDCFTQSKNAITGPNPARGECPLRATEDIEVPAPIDSKATHVADLSGHGTECSQLPRAAESGPDVRVLSRGGPKIKT